MEKIAEIIRLHFKLDLSVRQTSSALNVSRSSVGDYCQKFKYLNLDVDDFLKLSIEKQEELLFPKTPNISQLDNKKVLPDCNYLHNELKKRKKTGITLALLHEEYKDSNPNGYYSYTQFREHYKRYVNTINPSMKQIYLVGERLFVDYSGLTVPIINKKTGETNKAQIFVAVLGASGYTFVDASYSQQQKDFINSHVKAYEFFQGCPRVVVPDNLKSAVISNNKKGIVINESYAALARYYNMAVEPTRPYKPKDKAKAEQGVLGIQRWIIGSLRYQRFFSVDELNDAISILLVSSACKPVVINSPRITMTIFPIILRAPIAINFSICREPGDISFSPWAPSSTYRKPWRLIVKYFVTELQRRKKKKYCAFLNEPKTSVDKDGDLIRSACLRIKISFRHGLKPSLLYPGL